MRFIHKNSKVPEKVLGKRQSGGYQTFNVETIPFAIPISKS